MIRNVKKCWNNPRNRSSILSKPSLAKARKSLWVNLRDRCDFSSYILRAIANWKTCLAGPEWQIGLFEALVPWAEIGKTTSGDLRLIQSSFFWAPGPTIYPCCGWQWSHYSFEKQRVSPKAIWDILGVFSLNFCLTSRNSSTHTLSLSLRSLEETLVFGDAGWTQGSCGRATVCLLNGSALLLDVERDLHNTFRKES